MQKVKKILHLLFLFLIVLIIITTCYIRYEFPMTTVEELLFYMSNGVEKTDSAVFVDGFVKAFPFGILIYAFLIFLFYDLTFNHPKKYYPFNVIIKHRKIATLILCVITFNIVCLNMHIFTYIRNLSVKSDFIEKNYVNPKEAKITFNDKKNLIVIAIESLESTLGENPEFGENYIPELISLLDDEDVTVFRTYQNKSGMKMLDGSSWTTSSLISNTSGIPFKVPFGKKFTNDDFLNGLYNLGDLLADNGYHNELISSAYTSFGGLDKFFTKHGHYDIIDYDSYKDYGLELEENDKGPWGFNDNYLFKAAKQRLEVLSSKEEPFNLMLVSIDTHFPDGFVGDYSLNKYESQYANAYATESKLIYDFISWVKEQSFYDDTVIVIIGDHQSMKRSFFKDIDKNSRFVYTCYVNSFSKAKNVSNRKYTSLDTYPTILGAMNVQIEGNKLGLGINMFSDEITLAEKYGFKYLDGELVKNSVFYNKKLVN